MIDERTINSRGSCYGTFQSTEFILGDKAPGFLSSNAEGAKLLPETASHYKQAQDEAQEDKSLQILLDNDVLMLNVRGPANFFYPHLCL